MKGSALCMQMPNTPRECTGLAAACVEARHQNALWVGGCGADPLHWSLRNPDSWRSVKRHKLSPTCVWGAFFSLLYFPISIAREHTRLILSPVFTGFVVKRLVKKMLVCKGLGVHLPIRQASESKVGGLRAQWGVSAARGAGAGAWRADRRRAGRARRDDQGAQRPDRTGHLNAQRGLGRWAHQHRAGRL